MVTVNRVPEIKAVLDSGTDYLTLFSFLATMTVVISSALYNAFVLKRTLAIQKDISELNTIALKEQARAEAVADNRQQWINSLRDAVASYLSVGYELTSASAALNRPPMSPVTSMEQAAARQKEYDLVYAKLVEKHSLARLYFAKVELFLNPNEEDSKNLIGKMAQYIEKAYGNEPISDVGQEIVNVAQSIIKKEWIRVRDMV